MIHIWPGAQGGSHISTARDDITGGSTILWTLSEGLEIKLADFDADNATSKGAYLQ